MHSGRLRCDFPPTPARHSAEGGRGGNLFPPHQDPLPTLPARGRELMRRLLGRPDSLRPPELSLPNDSHSSLCGRGPGGKPVSPASRSPPYPPRKGEGADAEGTGEGGFTPASGVVTSQR